MHKDVMQNNIKNITYYSKTILKRIDLMYNKIYERKEFMIFQVKEGYIVYNAKKSFQEGHTHLKHFKAAKTAIDLVIRKKIPRSTQGYYLTSLIRLSDDDIYINKIKELMESRMQKGKKDKYYNSRHKV
jgi:hypothetical protein